MVTIHRSNNRRAARLCTILLSGAISIALPAVTMAQEVSSACSDSSGRTLVIIGASYAKDWPIRSLDRYEVINMGVGGDTSSQMLTRFENDVLAQSPCGVIIWGFINDIFRSPPSEMKQTKETIKTNFQQMVEMATGVGVRVYMATEVSIRPESGVLNWIRGLIGRARGRLSYQAQINHHVEDVNDWLRIYAAENDLVLLDFYSVLAGEAGSRKEEFASDDGSHLSVKAYDALSIFLIDGVTN